MGHLYYNITTDTAESLIHIDQLTNEEEVKSLSLCNVHATDSVDVDLYYYKTEDNTAEPNNWDDPGVTEYKYYLIKNNTILKGTTLQLNDEYDITFNNSQYSLYIKLSASDSAVDAIINIK